jgi:hypothetical protein
LAAANSSISAPHTQECPSDRFIESAAPEGIVRLAACLERLPSRTSFTVAELDAILEGDTSIERFGSLPDGSYLQNMLPRINWWVSVSRALTFGNTQGGIFCDPTQADKRDVLLSLLPPVFDGYVAALRNTQHYTEDDDYCVHLEFLKRYRILTKFICAWAEELWPNANLRWLHKQA